MKKVLIFLTIWNILRPFGIIYCRLVFFVVVWYMYFSHIGMFGPRKIWQPWYRPVICIANFLIADPRSHTTIGQFYDQYFCGKLMFFYKNNVIIIFVCLTYVIAVIWVKNAYFFRRFFRWILKNNHIDPKGVFKWYKKIFCFQGALAYWD
jgi:hypothetical protein